MLETTKALCYTPTKLQLRVRNSVTQQLLRKKGTWELCNEVSKVPG